MSSKIEVPGGIVQLPGYQIGREELYRVVRIGRDTEDAKAIFETLVSNGLAQPTKAAIRSAAERLGADVAEKEPLFWGSAMLVHAIGKVSKNEQSTLENLARRIGHDKLRINDYIADLNTDLKIL